MTQRKDPPRLLDDRDDLPKELDAALRALKDRRTSPERLSRLGAAFGIVVPDHLLSEAGLEATTAGGEAASSVVAGTSSAAKLVVGVLVLAGAGGAAYLLWPSQAPAPASVRVAPSRPAVGGLEIHEPLVERKAEDVAQRSVAAPPEARPGADPAEDPKPGIVLRSEPQPEPSEPSAPQRSVPKPSGPTPPARRSSADPERQLEKKPAPGVVAPSAERKGSELELLKQARTALRTDPAAALNVAEMHRAQYPSGAMSQERELIAITALVRLGRRGEATERANRFDLRYPDSVYRDRLDQLLVPTR